MCLRLYTRSTYSQDFGRSGIDNVTKDLFNLYATKNKENLGNSRKFQAIAKYLRECLNDMCKKRKICFERLYFVFLLPDEWGLDLNIIDLLMLPLLTEIGVVLPEDYRDRVLFNTRLEAAFSCLQLHDRNDPVPKFIQSENRCLLYEYAEDMKTLKIRSTYFQLKEDFSLRALDKKCHVPKIQFKNDDLVVDFNIENIQEKLKQVIFKDTMNLEHLMNDPPEDKNSGFKSAADEALLEILYYLRVSL